MRYFKQYKEAGEKPFEVTKEEAAETLAGYWNAESLKDIFDNDRCFRLWTPFSEVWTQTDNNMVPMPGFYGVAG